MEASVQLGRAIKDTRLARGLTREDVTVALRQAGLRTSLGTYDRWERTGSIKAHDLVGLARVLEIQPADLLESLTADRVA